MYDGLLTLDGSLTVTDEVIDESDPLDLKPLDLTAHLIILSACETGLGTAVSEGIMGLPHAFISQGIPSVIVSQWTVPDTSTAELMIDFHKNLQSGQSNAQALREAMLKTMKKYPDPVDWAGFSLIGASQTNQ